jgi:hypothetical protein
VTVATPEFNEGEEFMRWLELLEDYELLPEADED